MDWYSLHEPGILHTNPLDQRGASYESPLEAHARKIPSQERRKYPPKIPIPPDSEHRQTGNVFARHGSVFARHGSVFARHGSVFARHGSVFARHGSVFARHGSVFALQGDAAASPWYGRRDHIWNTYCVLTWATPCQPVRALLFMPGTCELFSLYAAYSSYWTFSRLSYSSNVIFIVSYCRTKQYPYGNYVHKLGHGVGISWLLFDMKPPRLAVVIFPFFCDTTKYLSSTLVGTLQIWLDKCKLWGRISFLRCDCGKWSCRTIADFIAERWFILCEADSWLFEFPHLSEFTGE